MNTLIKRMIIFLLRKRLGVKKFEMFTFSNQKSNSMYYFGDVDIMRVDLEDGRVEYSRVSLNWLLNDECKVTTIDCQFQLGDVCD